MANNRLFIKNTISGEEICIARSSLFPGSEKWEAGNSLTKESLQGFFDRLDYLSANKEGDFIVGESESNILTGGNQKSKFIIVTEQNDG